MDAITTVSDKAAALSDDDLVERVKHLVTCERRASVALIHSLLEFWLLQLRLLRQPGIKSLRRQHRDSAPPS